MVAVRKQYTLGSLMVVIAAIAVFLAVPRETWDSLAFWALNGAALMLLVLLGFGLGHAGSKLASGVGQAIGGCLAEERSGPPEAERPQCPPN